MSRNIYTYAIGDSFPNIQGVVSYAGSVKTTKLQAALLANGQETGPFTGDVINIGGESENQSSSTFFWMFSVTEAMTAVEGSYELSLKITHLDLGQTHTLNANLTIVVKSLV